MSQLRQQKLLEIVQAYGYASVELLAEKLGCSHPTVRRDINKLCEQHKLQRFHGGVSQLTSPVRLGYESKSKLMSEAKKQMSKRLVTHLDDQDSIFLDTGTTCEQVAHQLNQLSGKQIITHSLAAALILSTKENNHTVTVTGGTIRSRDGSLTGAKAYNEIRAYNADCSVISASGLDVNGNILDFDIEKVEVKKAMIEESNKRILLLDSSKFCKRGAIIVANIDQFDLCITDKKPSDLYVDLFEKNGISLDIAY